MASSGVKGLPTPEDGDGLVRRMEAFEKALQQGIASVAPSFQGTVNRLVEASAVARTQVALDTDSSGALDPIIAACPEWANYAMVTASYSVESGTTTREAVFPLQVLVADSPMAGQRLVTTANGFFTDDWWAPHEATTPVVVDLSRTNGQVVVYPTRTVMTPGTGDLFIDIFVYINWIE